MPRLRNRDSRGPRGQERDGRYEAAASEPETQTMQNFAISREFTMVFNYHAFGQVMNYP
ncbi:MAG: M14 family zinc carboxypeptidase, partial [Lysobacterales bacterium]